MPETLELPSGDVVTPDDVFLYNGYPYRFVPLDDDRYAFELAPLYWGGGEMNIPFPDRTALEAQWEPDGSGVLSEAEWEAWLQRAREDERFADAELDAIEQELGTDEGFFASLRDTLGLSR